MRLMLMFICFMSHVAGCARLGKLDLGAVCT